MAQTFREGRIEFEFPDEWGVLRPEDSTFYDKHFQNLCSGCKEMDFLLREPKGKVLWLLEVKDYTTAPRTKSADLFDQLAQKTRDSLALLVAAAANASPDNAGTRKFAKESLPPESIRVVLHLEQPTKQSKLFPGIKLKADATQCLRKAIRGVDRRAIVVSTSKCPPTPWTARWAG